MAVEGFDLAGEAAAFVALHHTDDLGELGLIPLLPRIGMLRRDARAPLLPLLPVVHVEPLDVADAHRRLHLLLAFNEDGLDVASLHADGDGDLIAADTGVAGGMLREERQHPLARQNAVRDRPPPVVAGLDLVLVEPDIVAALFQISVNAAGQFFVRVLAVAEEDAEG